jgi:hypothetical protein
MGMVEAFGHAFGAELLFFLYIFLNMKAILGC